MIQFRGQASVFGKTAVTPEVIQKVADIHGHEYAKLSAICRVEAKRSAFWADGRLKMLFEAHVFGRLTDHAHEATHPHLSSRRWDRDLYKGGPDEYPRIEEAMELDEEAALKSASWGAAQIMGFNHQPAGFASVHDMLAAFVDDTTSHVDAMCNFIEAKKIRRAVDLADWTVFARRYNGPGFARNAYHFKLACFWARDSGLASFRFGAKGQMALNLQTVLKSAGYNPGELDGDFGPKSATALVDFQRLTQTPYPYFGEEGK